MLLRYDPMRGYERVSDEPSSPTRMLQMPIDAYRRGDTFIVHVDVPGVDPEKVDLMIEHDTLTVSAERVWTEQQGDEVLVSERPQGTFVRRLLLGSGLDTDHIGAHCDRGVLTIRIPVASQGRARKVEITPGPRAEKS